MPRACQHLIGLFFGLLGPGTDKDTNKIIIIDQSCVWIGKYRAPDRSKLFQTFVKVLKLNNFLLRDDEL